MSPEDVVWGAAPKRRSARKSVWPSRLAPFVDHPGEEGMLPIRFTASTVSNVAGMLRKRTDLPGDGVFTFQARVMVEDGEKVGRIWATFHAFTPLEAAVTPAAKSRITRARSKEATNA